MVLKRGKRCHIGQLSPQAVERVSPVDYLRQVGFLSALTLQIAHHAPTCFHGALERTLDGGDEAPGVLDGTVYKLG